MAAHLVMAVHLVICKREGDVQSGSGQEYENGGGGGDGGGSAPSALIMLRLIAPIEPTRCDCTLFSTPPQHLRRHHQSSALPLSHASRALFHFSLPNLPPDGTHRPR